MVEQARLLAVNRPGYVDFDWADFYARNPYSRGRVDCIESTAIDISASELRGRLAVRCFGGRDWCLLRSRATYGENGLYAA